MAARMAPGARVDEFPGAGHSPYWDNAERYNQVLGRFLKEQRVTSQEEPSAAVKSGHRQFIHGASHE